MTRAYYAVRGVWHRLAPEWLVFVLGRPMCRVGWCNVTCRGRRDHATGPLPGNRYARWL